MKTKMPADLSRLVELLDTYKQSIITRWECASHNPDGCLCSRHEREKRQALLAAIAEIAEERDRLRCIMTRSQPFICSEWCSIDHIDVCRNITAALAQKEAKHG